MRLHCLLAVGVLLTSVPLTAQDLERPVQQGLKTTESGFAVATSVAIPMDDMARAGELFGRGLRDLSDMSAAEGFTPTGVTHIASLVFGMPEGGQMPFELRMLIADQPTEEDFDADYGFRVMELPPRRVAYTFHKGALDQSQGTVMELVNWAMAQNLQATGGPEFVLIAAGEDEPNVTEIRLPIE